MSFMSSFKGMLGETVINVALWLKLDKEVYHRLNNITLPLDNGGSTQIDHVIVSIYGIFVIETKNYKGWIFGKENQRQWTQVIMGRKYKFQNPLRQNYLHMKTLSALLNLEMNYFHSMIAFIGECELKTRDELPAHVLTSGMASYIKKKQDKILTDDEVRAIVAQIESNRFSKSWRTNQAHKAYLKDKHNQADKAVKTKSKAEFIIKHEPAIRKIVKSREVLRWSGQTEVEEANLQTVHPTSTQLNSDDSVYITPFSILDLQPDTNDANRNEFKNNQYVVTANINEPVISVAIPTCPKCTGEMIKRVAKKGARPGQAFFGCAQFPKCRGIFNIN